MISELYTIYYIICHYRQPRDDTPMKTGTED